jgi:hypothetical protein
MVLFLAPQNKNYEEIFCIFAQQNKFVRKSLMFIFFAQQNAFMEEVKNENLVQ